MKEPKRSIREALSEVKREVQVRDRCYPKWIDEGRITDVDAKDRFERMESALAYLQELADAPEAESDPFDPHEISAPDDPNLAPKPNAKHPPNNN